MNTCDHPNYMKTKAYAESLKNVLEACACDPYDLYGDQALHQLQKYLVRDCCAIKYRYFFKISRQHYPEAWSP